MTNRMKQEYPYLCKFIEDKSHAILEDMLAPGETDGMTQKDWLHVTLDYLDEQARNEYNTAVQLLGNDVVIAGLTPCVCEP